MTIKIQTDDDASTVRQKLGAAVDRHAVRTGQARQSRLLSNTRRQARDWDLDLEISEEKPTAHCEARTDGSYNVVITGGSEDEEFPWQDQSITSYPPKAWDLLCQRAFGVHEVGHIRYTDFDDWETRVDAMPAGGKGTAHSLHNALEDGAIEEQIMKRWPNYEEPLKALRATVFQNSTPGIEDPEMGGYVYPVAHAVQTACLELWMEQVYDITAGTVDALVDPDNDEHHFATQSDRETFVDEAMPLIEGVVPDVLSEPDAVKRNARIEDFVYEILDLLDDSDADGKSQQNGQAGDGEDGSGMPDDSRENHSGDAEADADELDGSGDASPSDEDQDDSEGAGDGSDGSEEDSEDSAGGAGDLTDIEDIEVSDDMAQQVAQTAAADARQEGGFSDDVLDEIDEMQSALGAADGLLKDTIQIPDEDFETDQRTYEAARNASRGLSQLLRNRLQQERRTETNRDQRRGRIDSTRLHRTAVERQPREIKKRRNQPEEKDYHCALILDRSGSMGGQMSAAEEATGMMLLALESVGVETMLIEMYGSQARLAKPFGVDTEQQTDRVFNGETGGGTPLDEVLDMTRERLLREDGNRFMVVLTDDELSGSTRANFESGLQKCPFPVLGVNMVRGGGSSDSADVYHREVTADPQENLQDTLESLVQEVMF